jgi:hypothetical protein
MSPRAVVRGRAWLEPLTPKSCKAVYRVEIEVRRDRGASRSRRDRGAHRHRLLAPRAGSGDARARLVYAAHRADQGVRVDGGVSHVPRVAHAPPEPPLSLDALIREYVSRPPLPPPPSFLGEPGSRARSTRRAARRLGRRRQRRQALAKVALAGAAAASVAAATASVGGSPASSPKR